MFNVVRHKDTLMGHLVWLKLSAMLFCHFNKGLEPSVEKPTREEMISRFGPYELLFFND